MANAVFIAKIDAEYDDAVEEKYHFPRNIYPESNKLSEIG